MMLVIRGIKLVTKTASCVNANLTPIVHEEPVAAGRHREQSHDVFSFSS